eukprot:12056765-Heterocapsa_arctica.AAC.1
MGARQADGGEKGTQNAGVADPGPPPAKDATPAMGPPLEWCIGQYTPASYTNKGVVDAWKQVQAGDVNPWDFRVAVARLQNWKDARVN